MQHQSSSPWEEFVLAAYRQAGSLLRDALGDNWFDTGVEPHTGEDARSLVRGLFEGHPSNGSVKPDESMELLRQIVVGNWDAFAGGFGGDIEAAEHSLDRLVLIAAEVAVKHGALPENVIDDFSRYGRALLEGLGSPAAGDIERIAARFPRAAERSEEEREMDKAVANTFPASDPTAASNPSVGLGPPDE